jgi:hypothetical protein
MCRCYFRRMAIQRIGEVDEICLPEALRQHGDEAEGFAVEKALVG